GDLVGEGVAQMHSLPPGRYLLALRVPRGHAPVRVRPAVVGLEVPGTGPPPDVLQSYLALAGADGDTDADDSAPGEP
ncbi:MAG: hypothetical protein AAGF23_06790, partial [Acidobacteriota bacterium]